MSHERRSLTHDESRILALLHDFYGPANTVDQVSFTDQDQAVIFVKDREGTMRICVNLTAIPVMQQLEGVPNDGVLDKYLRVP